MDKKDASAAQAPTCSGSESASGCPVSHGSGGPVLTPGGWRHDTENKDGLDTRGLASSIPKGGKDNEQWVYPSPQRFYSAMKKKGYNPAKEDVSSVVSIHNTVNEKCWSHIMDFEKFHCKECSEPKLLRFRGRPKDFSPKARFFGLIGYSLPFDRHDWVVDRCGKEVRYIIDFYKGKQVEGFPVSVYLDVRPEMSVGGAVDRIRMYFQNTFTSKPSSASK